MNSAFAQKKLAGCVFLVAVALLLAPRGVCAATVTHAPWGMDSAGNPVELYTIALPRAEVKVSTYGARIVKYPRA